MSDRPASYNGFLTDTPIDDGPDPLEVAIDKLIEVKIEQTKESDCEGTAGGEDAK